MSFTITHNQIQRKRELLFKMMEDKRNKIEELNLELELLCEKEYELADRLSNLIYEENKEAMK